ncbi:MAG: TIR domain-containing protein [Planctomycetota bacterium]
MEPFYYEIVAAPDGEDIARDIEQLLRNKLKGVAKPWPHPERPSQSDLYVLVLAVSPDLATDEAASQKVAHASGGDFPLIPVVSDLDNYKFAEAPLVEIQERNAESLANTHRLLQSLRTHGGLDLFASGGKAFISHARADGADMAKAIGNKLKELGTQGVIDVEEFPGGELIQHEIRESIRSSNLVILVDTTGANESDWVAQEIDMAHTARVPVVAVAPELKPSSPLAWVTHVLLKEHPDPVARIVREARRILARQAAFAVRVERTLRRLECLRTSWRVQPLESNWLLQTPASHLVVGATEERPAVEHIAKLEPSLGGRRGMLVAGVRPIDPGVAVRLERSSGGSVCVTTLQRMASKIPSRIGPTPLDGIRILLSASLPDEPNDEKLAQRTLKPLIVTLTQTVVELGGTLVFGGHPSITPLVNEALLQIRPARDGCGGVFLFLGRWFQQKLGLSKKVTEGPVFDHVRWCGDGEDMLADIAKMREEMIAEELRAAVFVGGRTDDYKGKEEGKKPGIHEEYDTFVRKQAGKHHAPERHAYPLGLARGAAMTIRKDPSKLDLFLRETPDPDLATALIVTDLIDTA